MPDTDGSSNERFDRIESTLERVGQRLDRFTERHQALAESVESLRLTAEASERRFEAIGHDISQLTTAVARLLNIAQIQQDRLNEHGRRLDDLEGGQR